MPELTTLCYISKGDDILFINKSEEDDPNCGKYLGIGGHFEEGETPEDCIIREIREETGLMSSELTDLTYRGLVTFVSDIYGVEYMHIFTSSYEGDRNIVPGNCTEGRLMWIRSSDIYGLPIWEGDKIIFDCLHKEKAHFFSLRLEYRGDDLIKADKNLYK